MRVLSLCDGISCGAVALRNLGVPVERYYAAEIKPAALRLTRRKWPSHIELGDVNSVGYADGNLSSERGSWAEDGIDLFLCGSPCQSFSSMMSTSMSLGLSDRVRSGLFLECFRVWREVRPRFWLWENVASMSQDNVDILSRMLGVEPVLVDSADFSAQSRRRLYWTNIPVGTPPPPCTDTLQDILDSGVAVDKNFGPKTGKSRCLTAGEYSARSNNKPPHFGTPSALKRHRKGFLELVCEGLTPDGKPDPETWRLLSTREAERLQTLPMGYTEGLKTSDAFDVIGDGWTIKVIEHLLRPLTDASTRPVQTQEPVTFLEASRPMDAEQLEVLW